MEMKDHYRVLGIRRQATIPAIKSAFRQLARQVQKSSSSSSSFRPSTLVGFMISSKISSRISVPRLQMNLLIHIPQASSQPQGSNR